jgi:hypothetical protein
MAMVVVIVMDLVASAGQVVVVVTVEVVVVLGGCECGNGMCSKAPLGPIGEVVVKYNLPELRA